MKKCSAFSLVCFSVSVAEHLDGCCALCTRGNQHYFTLFLSKILNRVDNHNVYKNACIL